VRLAILSDIHSNLEALEAALKIVEEKSPDAILCLGDIVGYGANPNECIELVRQNCDIVLLGNHDAALLDQSITYYFTPLARTAILWTLSQITEENIEFLRTLKMTATLDRFFLVHSSPTQPETWQYIIDEEDAKPHFSSFREEICFVGHSHIPGIYSLDGKESVVHHGKRYIINVGSIGQPRDRNPHMSFGFFDSENWTYELIRAPYPISTAANKILRANLPSVLAYRLFEGS